MKSVIVQVDKMTRIAPTPTTPKPSPPDYHIIMTPLGLASGGSHFKALAQKAWCTFCGAPVKKDG